MKTASKPNGRLPMLAVASCGTCARWDRLVESAQPKDGPARGVCCGVPPTVFHTPTEADPHATLSSSPLTTEGRPACHLWKKK